MPAPPCAGPHLRRSRLRLRAHHIVGRPCLPWPPASSSASAACFFPSAGRPLLPQLWSPRSTYCRGRQASRMPHSARSRPRRGEDGGDFRRAPMAGRPPLLPARRCPSIRHHTHHRPPRPAPLLWLTQPTRPLSSPSPVCHILQQSPPHVRRRTTGPALGLGWATEVRGRV
jgi:hypothetical protein